MYLMLRSNERLREVADVTALVMSIDYGQQYCHSAHRSDTVRMHCGHVTTWVGALVFVEEPE